MQGYHVLNKLEALQYHKGHAIFNQFQDLAML